MREEIKELVATAVYTSSPQYPELDNRAANYKNIKYTTDQILTLLDKEINKARVDGATKMVNLYRSKVDVEQYDWDRGEDIAATFIEQLEKGE